MQQPGQNEEKQLTLDEDVGPTFSGCCHRFLGSGSKISASARENVKGEKLQLATSLFSAGPIANRWLPITVLV
jgi:hypothetical protein